MADIILTLQQLTDLFYTVTCEILGLNPDDPSSFSKVRKSWQTDGTPAWGINDDVVFIRIKPLNDPYIQQRDTTYTQNTVDLANKITSYTRAHQVFWAVYGPNSFENAEAIRNGLYSDEVKSLLKASNISLKLDIPSPDHVPELYNGRWWERSDLSARFCEKVTRQTTVPYLQGANIQIKTEEGVTLDANTTT